MCSAIGLDFYAAKPRMNVQHLFYQYFKWHRPRGQSCLGGRSIDGCLGSLVDADFRGLFGHEDPADKKLARSRGAYIMIFGGLPLIWKTWLISHICLSSCESVFSALNKAMVQVIAVTKLVEELTQALGLESITASYHYKSRL